MVRRPPGAVGVAVCLFALAAAASGAASPAAPGDDLVGAADPQTFRFVTVEAAASGLDAVHRSGAVGADKRWMIECVGTGVGLVDVDDDGDLDVYFVQGGALDEHGAPQVGAASRDTLYLNDGSARFRDAGAAAGELSEGFGFGVTAGDVDGDGHEDLLVTNLGPDVLLANDGTGRFTRRPQAGLAGGDTDWSMGAAFGDPDGDGDLDVYVTNYLAHDLEHPMLSGRPCAWMGCDVPCGPLGLEAQADRFHLNDGAGRFTDETARAGLADVPPRYAFQPLFADLDADGDADLFVANDSVANSLFVNTGVRDGVPRFDELGMRTGLALSATGKEQAGMGVAHGDLDGDGRPDLVMTNFSRENNAVFLNASRERSGPMFFDEAGRSGLGRPSYFDLGWGANLFDVEHDGDLDLFVANGHVYPQVDGCEISKVAYAQPDRFYVQTAPGRFAPVADGPAAPAPWPSRGSAAGDLDGDGDVDLVVAHVDGPLRLLRNDTPAVGDWVRLDLRPVAASVGARVEVREGERVRVAEVLRGSSFLGTDDRVLHVGLGPAPDADGPRRLAVTVRWPDGLRETWTGIAPRDTVVLTRGGADH